MADNKVFDVAHPKTASEPTKEPVQARKIILNAPGTDTAETEANESSTIDSQEVVSHKAAKIEPISSEPVVEEKPEPKDDAKAEEDVISEPAVEETEEPTQNAEATSEPEQDAPEPEQPKDEDKPINTEPFAASDSLPDASEKAAAASKDAMQEPKIFDTKEYYVPIGDAHHVHNHGKSSLVVGVFIALLVVGAAVFYMYQMGS